MVRALKNGVGGNRNTEGFSVADEGSLSGGVAVIVDDSDTSERGHSSSHVGLGDGVHGGSDAGDGERDALAEARG